MAKITLDRVTAAGTLKTCFDLEDNSVNQSIIESKDSKDDQPLPEKYKVVSSSIVNRKIVHELNFLTIVRRE